MCAGHSMLCPYEEKGTARARHADRIFIARERRSAPDEEVGIMTKAIQQSVRFPASPKELFDIYLDSRKHSAATGGSARMSRKVGGTFTAWNEQLRGRNLVIVPNRLIVQAWRATHWKASEPDSILVLEFSKAPGGAQSISCM